ncbi:hypothetical protein [Phaeobacter sp. HF9A]|uniref:hypothetical protein n=1 Tax=Phaeobacter sp. HF9A TaxID=2721561 RepID=UPI001430C1CB|nr:hypothetical protein [Phaeobacter sp. HF9A]NIZ14114.1 hypothetical protein [Phaeobacter sp. HF9A]
MSKELQKLQAEYKKSLPALKKTTKADGEKLRKAMTVALEKCWDAEDSLRESLSKAREAGIASKKLADLQKDKGFKAGLAVWQKAVTVQKAALDEMMALIETAKSTSPLVAKLLSGAEKAGKASAKGSPEKKEIDALIAALKAHQADQKIIAGYAGKMKPGDKFYAVQSKKILEKMLSEDGKATTSEADLPKLLEEKLLKRNSAKIQALAGAVQEAHKAGMQGVASDAKAAQTQAKVGAMKLKELTKLVGEYQRARKKCAKDIKEIEDAKARKKLLATLDTFDKLQSSCEARLKELLAEIKKTAATA